ncbi:MAG: hypothetical protein RLZZ252_1151, partial [Bacteroidota bacterium]
MISIKKYSIVLGFSLSLPVFAQTTATDSSESDKMDEVVIIGYGKASKKEFTGANSSLKGQSLEKLNIPRMDQALQGQIPGVVVSTNSG